MNDKGAVIVLKCVLSFVIPCHSSFGLGSPFKLVFHGWAWRCKWGSKSIPYNNLNSGKSPIPEQEQPADSVCACHMHMVDQWVFPVYLPLAVSQNGWWHDSRFELVMEPVHSYWAVIGLVLSFWHLNFISERHMTAISDARLIYGRGHGVFHEYLYMRWAFKL